MESFPLAPGLMPDNQPGIVPMSFLGMQKRQSESEPEAGIGGKNE
jgi:hypothetical protein